MMVKVLLVMTGMIISVTSVSAIGNSENSADRQQEIVIAEQNCANAQQEALMFGAKREEEEGYLCELHDRYMFSSLALERLQIENAPETQLESKRQEKIKLGEQITEREETSSMLNERCIQAKKDLQKFQNQLELLKKSK
jgi:hypothetical protein